MIFSRNTGDLPVYLEISIINARKFIMSCVQQTTDKEDGVCVLHFLGRLCWATSANAMLTELQHQHLESMISREKLRKANLTCGFETDLLATQIATWINGVHVANKLK